VLLLLCGSDAELRAVVATAEEQERRAVGGERRVDSGETIVPAVALASVEEKLTDRAVSGLDIWEAHTAQLRV